MMMMHSETFSFFLGRTASDVIFTSLFW